MPSYAARPVHTTQHAELIFNAEKVKKIKNSRNFFLKDSIFSTNKVNVNVVELLSNVDNPFFMLCKFINSY